MCTRRTYTSPLFKTFAFIAVFTLFWKNFQTVIDSSTQYLSVYATNPVNYSILPPKLTENDYILEPKRNYQNIFYDYCTPSHLEPWHWTISNMIKPNIPRTHKNEDEMLTKLINGSLIKNLNSDDSDCEYRCLLPVNDRTLEYGEWKKIENGKTKPQCDNIETKCYLKSDMEKPFFEHMHAQIYRKKQEIKLEQAQPPDVHIILIDSVSHNSMRRGLPKTINKLISSYGAVPFAHANKVGINSHPNAFPLFMGKQLREIKATPVSVGYPSDYDNNTACSEPLDDDQYIMSRFKAAGYKTLYSDDWAATAFNWPNCVGFGKNPADHTMKYGQNVRRAHNAKTLVVGIVPFFLRIGTGISTYSSVPVKASIESFNDMHEILLEQLERFINAYPNTPKFTITWTSYLAHDDNNNLFIADDYFHDFFTRNEEKLKNSYIFLMGDHGTRFGQVRKTNIGETEDSNPALFVVLPELLQQNFEVMDTVRENSHQLTSHYDFYATLADIARPKQNNVKKIILHGSSFLRPFPQPRTCDRLRVPMEFCSCSFPKTKLPDNSNIDAAWTLINHMNEIIKTDMYLKDLCIPVTLNTSVPVEMQQLHDNGDYTVYLVTFGVAPGNGLYTAYVGRNLNGDYTALSTEFTSIHQYWPNAFCAVNSEYVEFCYCKELIEKEKTEMS